MKKYTKAVTIVVAIMLMMALLTACAEKAPEWQFEVGEDAVTSTTEGSNEYAGTFNVNLKVVGGNDTELFNGVVTITTNTQWCSEVIKAAVTDKGIAQEGIDVGFITRIGDYENNSETGLYWLYEVNGVSPNFGCSTYQFRDGDYIVLEYKGFEE